MTENQLSTTFAALADPTRRAILARLAAGEASVTELAEPFAMTLPAVTKHLKVLQRAGLITRGRRAQWRPCRLAARPLREVADWVEPDRLARWWGPKGFTMLSSTLDLRPGGIFHYGMRSPDGREMWGRWVFREVVAPERLVFVASFSDEAGGVTRHPFAPDWPLE